MATRARGLSRATIWTTWLKMFSRGTSSSEEKAEDFKCTILLYYSLSYLCIHILMYIVRVYIHKASHVHVQSS